MLNGQYQAKVGDELFVLTFKDGQLQIDEREVGYSSETISPGHVTLLLDGQSHDALVVSQDDGSYQVTIGHRRLNVRVKDERALLLDRFGFQDTEAAAEREIRAPMPGLVLQVHVQPGQAVQAGERLLVLEAMKMENELRSPTAGTIGSLHVAQGDAVGKHELLIELAS